MKTKEQIKTWLSGQPWYDKYMTNATEQNRPWYDNYKANTAEQNPYGKECTDRILNSTRPDWLISGSFLWHKTPEGPDYWTKVDKEFRKWFNDKNK